MSYDLDYGILLDVERVGQTLDIMRVLDADSKNNIVKEFSDLDSIDTVEERNLIAFSFAGWNFLTGYEGIWKSIKRSSLKPKLVASDKYGLEEYLYPSPEVDLSDKRTRLEKITPGSGLIGKGYTPNPIVFTRPSEKKIVFTGDSYSAQGSIVEYTGETFVVKEGESVGYRFRGALFPEVISVGGEILLTTTGETIPFPTEGASVIRERSLTGKWVFVGLASSELASPQPSNFFLYNIDLGTYKVIPDLPFTSNRGASYDSQRGPQTLAGWTPSESHLWIKDATHFTVIERATFKVTRFPLTGERINYLGNDEPNRGVLSPEGDYGGFLGSDYYFIYSYHLDSAFWNLRTKEKVTVEGLDKISTFGYSQMVWLEDGVYIVEKEGEEYFISKYSVQKFEDRLVFSFVQKLQDANGYTKIFFIPDFDAFFIADGSEKIKIVARETWQVLSEFSSANPLKGGVYLGNGYEGIYPFTLTVPRRLSSSPQVYCLPGRGEISLIRKTEEGVQVNNFEAYEVAPEGPEKSLLDVIFYGFTLKEGEFFCLPIQKRYTGALLLIPLDGGQIQETLTEELFSKINETTLISSTGAIARLTPENNFVFGERPFSASPRDAFAATGFD